MEEIWQTVSKLGEYCKKTCFVNQPDVSVCNVLLILVLSMHTNILYNQISHLATFFRCELCGAEESTRKAMNDHKAKKHKNQLVGLDDQF